MTMLRAVGGGELATGPLLGSLVVCGPDVSKHPARRAPAHDRIAAGMFQGAESLAALLGGSEQDNDSGVHAVGVPQPRQRLQLRPRSADIGSLYAVDFLPLSDDRFLVAAHPSGVLVMRRYSRMGVQDILLRLCCS